MKNQMGRRFLKFYFILSLILCGTAHLPVAYGIIDPLFQADVVSEVFLSYDSDSLEGGWFVIAVKWKSGQTQIQPKFASPNNAMDWLVRQAAQRQLPQSAQAAQSAVVGNYFNPFEIEMLKMFLSGGPLWFGGIKTDGGMKVAIRPWLDVWKTQEMTPESLAGKPEAYLALVSFTDQISPTFTGGLSRCTILSMIAGLHELSKVIEDKLPDATEVTLPLLDAAQSATQECKVALDDLFKDPENPDLQSRAQQAREATGEAVATAARVAFSEAHKPKPPEPELPFAVRAEALSLQERLKEMDRTLEDAEEQLGRFRHIKEYTMRGIRMYPDLVSEDFYDARIQTMAAVVRKARQAITAHHALSANPEDPILKPAALAAFLATNEAVILANKTSNETNEKESEIARQVLERRKKGAADLLRAAESAPTSAPDFAAAGPVRAAESAPASAPDSAPQEKAPEEVAQGSSTVGWLASGIYETSKSVVGFFWR